MHTASGIPRTQLRCDPDVLRVGHKVFVRQWQVSSCSSEQVMQQMQLLCLDNKHHN